MFELAHKGTIFLDEISELPLHLQSKLLRVLQEKEVMKIGGNKFIPVDIRVITATNRDLKECIKEKTFREDLYYRISVLPVYIPPLRERIEDIGQIVEHYFCKNEEIKVTHKLLNVLFSYHWPGNVRELINVLERFQAICHGEELHEDKAVEYMKQALYTANAKIYKLANAEYDQLNLKELEKRTIQLALHAAEGNKDTTAELLGISRTTLWRKLKEYGLDVK